MGNETKPVFLCSDCKWVGDKPHLLSGQVRVCPNYVNEVGALPLIELPDELARLWRAAYREDLAAMDAAGKRGVAGIIGAWPGDETDEEIAEALAALDGPRCVDAALLRRLDEVWPREWYTLHDGGRVAVVIDEYGDGDTEEYWGATLGEALRKLIDAREADGDARV